MSPGADEPVAIRRASPPDVDRLVPLFGAYREFYRQRTDPAAERRFLDDRLAAEEAVVFLAEAGGVAIGFTLLYPVFSSERLKPGWILNDLYVAPEHRARGVGAALLRRAVTFARESGAAFVSLETAKDNPAQRLYAAEGWVRDDVFLHFEKPV